MTTSLNPHLRMKDSGVEWFSDVPEHWSIRRLRNVANVLFSNVDKHSKNDEVAVRLCNYSDVYHNDSIHSGMSFMQATANADEIERFRLHPGDVLITKDSESWDDIGVPALVQNSASDIVCGYHLALLRPISGIMNGSFLHRALTCPGVAIQFFIRANGVTRFGLAQAAIKSCLLPVPPPTEQAAIARFLDHATEKIERHIRAKEKLIALLEEQKQVVIHDAVTGRIDVRTGKAYPKYMPADISWLGDLPINWEVKQLGRIGRFFKGNGGTKMDEEDDGVPCVRYGDLYTQHEFFIFSARSYIASDMAETAYTELKYGDILFAASGETIEDIGKSAANLIDGRAFCGGDVIIFRPSIDINTKFLGYAADSPMAARQKGQMGRGFTVIHIYGTALKNMIMPIPPRHEQDVIVHFLEKTISENEFAQSQMLCEIELLREYRTRLIADVVTGKLDVREAAKALPDDLEEANA